MKTKLIVSIVVTCIIGAVVVMNKNNSMHNSGGEAHAGPINWDKGKETYTGPLDITVYRSPTCRCCSGWIKHLAKNGFKVTDVTMDDVSPIKRKHNMPREMESCHTAIIDGYLVEGHVPADDIKRLLKTKPDVAGLSVPEMPVGTPGMEMDNRKDPFAVISFDKNGRQRVFNEYRDY